jgi:histidinol-phosphatase
MTDLRAALDVALEAARAASVPILRHFRTPNLAPTHKGDGSPVTIADQQAERVIREVLEARTPDFDVLGEEEGLQDRGRRYRWVVDPIDGTISFSRGVPLFGTLIGLEDRESGKNVVGVIHLPAIGETYSGGRGLGAWCGPERLRIRDRSIGEAYESAIVGGGDPLWFTESDRKGSHDLVSKLPLFRGCADCFAHAMVLRGAYGANVDPGLQPWDLAATAALIEEAGGALYATASAQEGKTDAIFGAPTLVEHLVSVLGW